MAATRSVSNRRERQRHSTRAHASALHLICVLTIGGRSERSCWRHHGHDDAQLVRGLDGAAQRLGQRLINGIHAVQRHELVRAARTLHRQLQRDAVQRGGKLQLLLDVLLQDASIRIACDRQRRVVLCACPLNPQDARLDAARRSSRGLVVVDAVAATRAHKITSARDGGR